MKKKTFSIKEALSFGWDTFRADLWFFLALMFGLFAVFSILGALQSAAKGMHPLVFALINVASLIVNILAGMGLIRVVLGFIHQKKPSIREAFSFSTETFFPYVIGSFLYALIVIAGMILLFIPGIVWGLKYQFFGYFLLDKKCEPKEALKRSAQITKGVKKKLFGFLIVLSILNIIGALLFGIGLLITIPVTLLSVGFIYNTLSLKNESALALERVDTSAHPGVMAS